MANIQKASAGINLAPASAEAGPDSTRGVDIHLDEEGLKLTTGRVDVANVRPGHQCRDIGHEVAKCRIKNQPVDGLVEGLREQEGGDDEHGSQ